MEIHRCMHKGVWAVHHHIWDCPFHGMAQGSIHLCISKPGSPNLFFLHTLRNVLQFTPSSRQEPNPLWPSQGPNLINVASLVDPDSVPFFLSALALYYIRPLLFSPHFPTLAPWLALYQLHLSTSLSPSSSKT